MQNKTLQGHVTSFFTILVWGTTYISTKILLKSFSPVEILFTRFIMAYAVLFIINHKMVQNTSIKKELLFAGAGLCGICLYYLLENIALTYTMASNVGVIISVAPFITSLLSHFFLKDESKITIPFYLGFVTAIIGIALISFNSTKIQLNPTGDFLAFLASIVWSAYSILTRKIGKFGYETIQATRRIFFYGIIFMIPAMLIFDFKPNLSLFIKAENLFNLLFLGIFASALCFAAWNFSVKTLGATKTSIYIYLVPVITVTTSVIVLKEPVSFMSITGMILAVAGSLISSL